MASGCCRRLWVAYRWGCQLPVASCLSVGSRESPVGSCLMPALVLVRHYLTQLNWTLVAKLSWQLPLVCLCVSRLQCIAAKCLPLPQQLASDPPHTSHHSSLSLFLQLSHIALPALRWFLCAKFVANHLTVYKVETLSCTSDCVPTPMPMPPIMPTSTPKPMPCPCPSGIPQVCRGLVYTITHSLTLSWLQICNWCNCRCC